MRNIFLALVSIGISTTAFADTGFCQRAAESTAKQLELTLNSRSTATITSTKLEMEDTESSYINYLVTISSGASGEINAYTIGLDESDCSPKDIGIELTKK